MCFGINKDMVRVIAEAAAGCGDRRVNGDGGGAPVGGGGRDVYTPTTTRMQHGRGEGGQAATKPIAR